MDFSFYIEQQQQGFKLSWQLGEYDFVDSILLYKGIGIDPEMQLFQSFPTSVHQYTDEQSEPYEPVTYAFRLKSDGAFTPFSQSETRIWAQENVMVLTYYGYALYRLSFDLKQMQSVYYTNLPFYHFDIKDQTIAFTSPIYDQLSSLELGDGVENQVQMIPGAGPVLFSPNSNHLFMAATEKPYTLYKLNTSFAILDSIQILSRLPVQLLHIAPDQYVLADSSSILFFNPQLQITDSVRFINGEVYSAVFDEGNIYTGLWDDRNSESILVKTNLTTMESSEQLRFSGNAFNVQNDTIWIEEREDVTKLVKLSQNGTRLLNLDTFSNITGIILHNERKYIYISERYADQISLYDTQGNFISKINAANSILYDPIRIKLIDE